MNASVEVIIIVGPTASGKTGLALQFAQAFNGEIICADSRTIYKGLDVSTAKPTVHERGTVRHHLLDIRDPNQPYSAAEFQEDAKQIVQEIKSRHRLPILVGGTGLYIDSFVYGFQFGPEANTDKRRLFESMTIDELITLLQERSIPIPENYKNKRYLIRALERGKDYAANKSPIPQGYLMIGLQPSKEVLLARIEKRAVDMTANGAFEEAQWLYRTYGFDVPAAQAPFFKAYEACIVEGVDVAVCQQRDITLNRQLAKRQMTWFKRNKSIHWFENSESAYNFIQEKLR